MINNLIMFLKDVGSFNKANFVLVIESTVYFGWWVHPNGYITHRSGLELTHSLIRTFRNSGLSLYVHAEYNLWISPTQHSMWMECYD